MGIFRRNKTIPQKRSNIGLVVQQNKETSCCVTGYVSLDKCPEIVAAVMKIAELIASMTIHLMSNTDEGDVRIVNELSRRIDIEPMPNMTRMTWMQGIVKNLLLEGAGNAIVVPHTYNGLLMSLEPISAERVSWQYIGYRDYKVLIDGIAKNPENLLHFVYNPDKTYLWKGIGLEIPLRELARNLKQAQKTTNAFLASEWKPSIIVKVDALTEEFSDPKGRKKLEDSYLNPSQPGAPWIIPAELIDVEQIKPLTLKDLAISENVELDKKTVAALLGIPAFVLGVGEYKKDEWNNFVQTKIRALALILQQELTKKLITSPKWYLQFNVWSLLDYDLQTVSQVMLAGSDRGFVSGDEWRNRVNLPPAGLDEFRVLENYIPWDMSGAQKKLVQEGE